MTQTPDDQDDDVERRYPTLLAEPLETTDHAHSAYVDLKLYRC